MRRVRLKISGRSCLIHRIFGPPACVVSALRQVFSTTSSPLNAFNSAICLVERVSTEQERTPSERGAGGKPVVPIFRGRWRYWAAAASVVLLVGVGAALMMRGPDQEELAMAQVEAFSISVRGDSTTTDPYAVDLMNARRWLLDQHPEEAFALLQKPRSTPCQDAERRWLLGLAYLLTQEETKARAEISAVAQAGCAVSAKAAELLERI